MDCYTDPLGWKHRLAGSRNVSYEASSGVDSICNDVKDLDKLYSLILELGKGSYVLSALKFLWLVVLKFHIKMCLF